MNNYDILTVSFEKKKKKKFNTEFQEFEIFPFIPKIYNYLKTI